jgi:hypothetical protein
LPTYYDPVTCEIIHATTYFLIEGVWRRARCPDWQTWKKSVWQKIQMSRQALVCASMNHSPEKCHKWKEPEEYNHAFYEHDE